MATPHVAGIAALLMSAKPKTPARDIIEVIEVIKSTAKRIPSGSNRPDNRRGYGIVQPVEALKALA